MKKTLIALSFGVFLVTTLISAMTATMRTVKAAQKNVGPETQAVSIDEGDLIVKKKKKTDVEENREPTSETTPPHFTSESPSH